MSPNAMDHVQTPAPALAQAKALLGELNAIDRAGRIEGMESLRDSAVRSLAEGVTTFEEVVRLTADTE